MTANDGSRSVTCFRTRYRMDEGELFRNARYGATRSVGALSSNLIRRNASSDVRSVRSASRRTTRLAFAQTLCSKAPALVTQSQILLSARDQVLLFSRRFGERLQSCVRRLQLRHDRLLDELGQLFDGTASAFEAVDLFLVQRRPCDLRTLRPVQARAWRRRLRAAGPRIRPRSPRSRPRQWPAGGRLASRRCPRLKGDSPRRNPR